MFLHINGNILFISSYLFFFLAIWHRHTSISASINCPDPFKLLYCQLLMKLSIFSWLLAWISYFFCSFFPLFFLFELVLSLVLKVFCLTICNSSLIYQKYYLFVINVTNSFPNLFPFQHYYVGLWYKKVVCGCMCVCANNISNNFFHFFPLALISCIENPYQRIRLYKHSLIFSSNTII